ncbi:MAG: aminomethyltransferase family protein [Deltaproteobacteria bacterium]|nr:aminomethyltransferase family protein [Deltaproteobacteria bacterium]
MQPEPHRTPLYDWHKSHGANILDFRGWAMPLWYPAGAVAEHLAVIQAAGLFDTSHMSVLTVDGPDSLELLQLCFTRDLKIGLGKRRSPLVPGIAVFGAFLNEQGHVVDDAVLFHMDADRYAVVVNAGKGGEVKAHLDAHRGELAAQVADLTGRVGKIDLQGPKSARILLGALEDPHRVLDEMDYFSFRGDFDPGSPLADVFIEGRIPVMVSGTGYSGEFGFELFMAADRLPAVWEKLLAAGADFGLIPCGLAARDSLRAGAVLPLSGQDIGPWPFINHPWHHALPFDRTAERFTKKFVGDVVLEKKGHGEFTYPFVGYDPRKVSIHDPAVVLDENGSEIGVVTTCVADMAIDWHNDRVYSIASPGKPEHFKPRGLICGFARVNGPLAVGRIVVLKDNKRSIRVAITNDVRPDRTATRPMRDML